MDEYDGIIKIIIVGESGVGKSALLSRYCDNNYSINYTSTIGVDFRTKTLDINNKKVKLQIWDTAGQERFRSITSSYYRGANAVMLVFDLTNIHSFARLEIWMRQIKQYMPDDKHKIILVGNKCESSSASNVDRNMVKELCSKNNIEYIETSAKQNINVEEAFMKLVEQIIDDLPRKEIIVEFDKKKSKISCCN
ncbi:rab family small GTPase [Tupanvirus deep ocean]|uniref:Rab family small GTPase n=2 Tax=Tupanvirus TaxID=2094720 RepID=A0AC62A922_9VIRU|nr:rab family small GTPase [Tupanvirus deep ocean]QKU34262.1 rab family small GTPase [Tupanvirus deep ocean]